MLLKRRTAQNIVWGGAAGCMPVLIGWAAVTGRLSWAPVVLFAVVFFWTPPHFWALAIRYREDYARADVPMLPVVASPLRVARDIVIYSWLTVAASLALWPLATGWLYGDRWPRWPAWCCSSRPTGSWSGRGRGARRQADAAVPPVQQLPGLRLRRGGRGHLRPLTGRAAAWPAASYDRLMSSVVLATCATYPPGTRTLPALDRPSPPAGSEPLADLEQPPTGTTDTRLYPRP